MRSLEGRAALVANAASPIGQAIVQRLAAEGARVKAADGDWDQAIAAIVDAHGRLDILVTIATAQYAAPKPISETSLEEFKAVNAENLESAFLGIRAGVIKMRALGNGGAVVNVASVFATRGLAGQAASAASANGIRMMTRAAALSCAEAKDGIRVNAVQFGPLGQSCSPDDVAAAVAFLVSPRASYITGFVLPVDGGLLAV